ncbi:hypothetical protein ACHHYP_20589 [Achlya hypogyna]|uniref:Uncharacterized protein n=1 Tax=Achlya hypogyna TaxID=1202772 RepID=A0A1V9YI12_ACHHY|nr:hypothetical protein ACHHYP_20589 [Achlya hypogyna]
MKSSQLKTKEDYHGNFNSEIFEKWFKVLCGTLKESYGSYIIHLDGAKYHKRVLNPVPNGKWLKAQIQAWLTYETLVLYVIDLVYFSSRRIGFNAAMYKVALLLLAKSAKEPVQYATVAIARVFGHHVLFTPPIILSSNLLRLYGS